MSIKTRNYIKDFNHPDFAHGELRGYQKGCRCLECKRAKADYNLKQKGVKAPAYRKLLGMQPDNEDYPHGTRTGYKYCKCEKCRQANNDYKRSLNKVWREKPENKATIKSCGKEWRESDRGRARRRSNNAERKTLIRASRPTCKVLVELLTKIYEHCPDGYHVDHIKPIKKGGAHKPSNLQYLPAVINMRKRDDENFDCASHVVRWQDLLEEPSTTIPQGSTVKRPEVPRTQFGS